AVPRQHTHAAAPSVARRTKDPAVSERPDPARPGDNLFEGDGEGAGTALPDGPGVGRGRAAVSRRRANRGAAGGPDRAPVALVSAQSAGGKLTGCRHLGVWDRSGRSNLAMAARGG